MKRKIDYELCDDQGNARVFAGVRPNEDDPKRSFYMAALYSYDEIKLSKEELDDVIRMLQAVRGED